MDTGYTAETSRLDGVAEIEEYDEKTPLISSTDYETVKGSRRWRITEHTIGTIKIIVSTITAPLRYVIACFYNEQGYFSATLPVYRIARALTGRRRKTEGHAGQQAPEREKSSRRTRSRMANKTTNKRSPSAESTSAISSDSEADGMQGHDSPARHTRSRGSIASSSGDEIAPSKKSIRIRLHNEDASRQRKRKGTTTRTGKNSVGPEQTPSEAAAQALKSPSSPATTPKITKFPRAPHPPRPLVPRRQPSYSASGTTSVGPHAHKKTLVIDLDETLIHSMSKGGRFTTGHMVEVRLQQPVQAAGAVLTPQVPILYYVHKRPHCDEFLRKVSKWYNLIVFTASVQEYADPVINWLELERKYFCQRLYRQHCTFRNGSYIKDLTHVEPDLSKVMILDNSPMSYVFHEDNAIPIEGWISDPTDNDLLHLIPFLEGLQYVTDVRALLALRLGEPQTV
ncbi:hypothetical protein EJ05DRAFT_305702 [Pseudovirgaria hyperparasitica]|uniref:FCP1 homology domain-containing protein n=1 Tax=Pseudovirgaria hyperparasitica TaxID=470096 RepID=A0A6A6WEW1_9PEZI|nr:uncharacterized protein EJ05DRAFT_305702 [Pseudovirgaria hyperparasitica]KAF2759651.1 hypothetical protein EJ05DRAFT_305702 [Pseudovirgaria hyperparasitica]